MTSTRSVPTVVKAASAIVGISAALPVFVGSSLDSVGLAGTVIAATEGGGIRLHWSVVVGPVLLAVLRIRAPGVFEHQQSSAIRVSSLLLAGWLTAVASVAAVATASLGPIVLTLQLFIPVSYYFVGRAIGRHPSGGPRTLSTFLVTLVVYQVILLASNADMVIAGDARGVAERFPEFQTYYPGLVALGICAGSALVRKRPGLVAVFALTVAFLLPAVWSRLGVVIIGLAVLVAAFWVAPRTRTPHGRLWSRSWRVGLVTVALVVSAQLVLTGSIGDRIQDKANPLQSGRYDLMHEAWERIAASPAYGDASVPKYDRADFGGMSGQGRRLFPSHNQLLDLGIRGGVPAMVLGAWLAAGLMRAAVQFRREGSSPARAGGIAVAVLLVASISDLYFSQAITASPGWMILGLAMGSGSPKPLVEEPGVGVSDDQVMVRRPPGRGIASRA